MPNLVALKAANERRWANAKLTRGPEFTPVAKRLVADKSRFQGMEAQTGVPWFVIAVIKERESGADPKWLKSIAQGQPWSKKSTIVPIGRGPFNSWEEAAYDALMNCAPKAGKNKDWSIGGTLTLLEQYNGLGYANKGLPSPYIWSGTDQYQSGKYIRDGVFSAGTVDKQLGCAGILLAMEKLDKTIFLGGPQTKVPTPKTVVTPIATAPAPVASEKPGIFSTLWGSLRGKDATVDTTSEKNRPGLHPTGDPVLYDQQAMLSSKGYTEVGQPDGLMGARTVNAIRAFRAENGLPAGDAIDARFAAALAQAGSRQVSKARVEATASDLREKGNSQVAALDSFGWVGKLLLGGGLLGGADQTGILSKANDTLQSAQDTLGTVTTVFTTIIGMAQWCFAHWWMFALGGGIYIAFRVATGILNFVVLYRRGFVTDGSK